MIERFLVILVGGNRNISARFGRRSVGAFRMRKTVGYALADHSRAIASSSGPERRMHMPSCSVVRQVSGEDTGGLTLTARRAYQGGPDGRFRIGGGGAPS